jgi:hypothetical protein
MSSDFDNDRSGGTGAGRPVGEPPVLLVTVYDPVEAEIIVSKLRSAGIQTFVRHEALSVVAGLTVDGCGQQDIMVRSEDLSVARAALEPEP